MVLKNGRGVYVTIFFVYQFLCKINYKLERPREKIRLAEIRTKDAVVVNGVVVVVVGVVVVGVVGMVVAVAVAAVAVIAGVVVEGIVDIEGAEFAPDDADGVSRRAGVVSVNEATAPVETDALSPALPSGCKVDCGDVEIPTDTVVSASSSALRLAGLGSMG
jgi:hypothetical protein